MVGSPGGRPRLLRTLWSLVIVVVVAVVGAIGTDVAIAINAERSFAKALMHYSRASGGPGLQYEPEITISGFPAYRSVESRHYSSIGITARAVDITGAGTCTDENPCHADLRSRMTDVTLEGPGKLFRPDSAFGWSRATSSVTLDSVAVGRLLGIDDLTVNTPAPRGRAGSEGPQDGLLSRTSGVLLTGSVSPGPGRAKERYSVVVDLSLVDVGQFQERARITATDFYDGPAEHSDNRPSTDDRAAVLAQFTATLPWLPMPWGAFPEEVHSSGSDLMVEGAPYRTERTGFVNFMIRPSEGGVLYVNDRPR